MFTRKLIAPIFRPVAPWAHMRRLSILGMVSLSVIATVSLVGCHSRTTPSSDSSRSSPSATLAGEAPVNAGAPKTNKPRVVSLPDPATLESLYPQDADGSNGMVRITVTLDKAGRATDTHIVLATPPDLGFEAAASTLAHLMSFNNPTGHVVSVTFNVKFVAPPHLSRLQRKLQRLR